MLRLVCKGRSLRSVVRVRTLRSVRKGSSFTVAALRPSPLLLHRSKLDALREGRSYRAGCSVPELSVLSPDRRWTRLREGGDELQPECYFYLNTGCLWQRCCHHGFYWQRLSVQGQFRLPQRWLCRAAQGLKGLLTYPAEP